MSDEGLRIGPVTFRIEAEASWRDAMFGVAPAFVAPVRCTDPVLEIGEPRGAFQRIVEAGREVARYERMDGGLRVASTLPGAALRVAIALHLPPPRWLALHGAALVFGQRAVLALGVSGAGKSTLSTLAGGTLLSDELVLLDTRELVAWGTPIRSSSPREPEPGSARLAALLTLRKSPTAELRALDAAAGVAALLESVAPMPGEDLPTLLDACVAVADQVPCFELSFARDDRFVPLLTEICAA